MDKDKNTDKTRSSAMHSKPIHANAMNERIDDEEWVKEVRHLMVGREVKAPNHLLVAVRQALADPAQVNSKASQTQAEPSQKKSVSSQQARLVPLRGYRWIAAAAVVVAIALPVTIHMLRTNKNGEVPTTLSSLRPAALSKSAPTSRSKGQDASALQATPSSISSPSSSYLAFNESAVDRPSIPDTLLSETQPSPATQPSSSPHTVPDAQQAPAANHKRSSDNAATNTPLTPTPTSAATHSLSVTAYCGGIGSGSGQGSGMTQGILLADAAPYGITPIEMREGAGKNGLVAVGRKRMKAHHAQPVKVGVSVGYSLTNRWSVNTGITYSYLSSDFTAEGEPKQTQQLHYVGIPLSGSYSLLKSRKAEVYVTAGGEVEKLVKGTVSSKNGLSGNHDEKVRESRPQFSAKAALGGAYHFTSSLSVYAEPGVSYYFNNHSSVFNVYKDRPTSFSLNVGLRYTVK